MGLVPSVVQMIARLHQRYHFGGPLLTLGVLDIPATYDQVAAMLEAERVPVAHVPPAERELSAGLMLRNQMSQGAQFVHARTCFRMFGIEGYADLDASDSEDPTLIHDLNTPIPREWHGRYGLVIDGGTTEHILDIRSTLSNIHRLTAVGGTAIHMNPIAGWVNHGFFQLSPCLYYDFYEANGFAPLEAYIMQLPAKNIYGPARILEYKHSTQSFMLSDPAYRSVMLFAALKQREVDQIRMPVQGKYRARMDSPRSACA